jgi:4,5-dihydroxyphthalate decarboxylase
MLLSSELDASILYISANNLVDRSKVDLSSHPDIRPLFPDQRAEGIAYYHKTGFFPINHGFVIKREVHQQQP